LLFTLYGDRYDFLYHLERLLAEMAQSWLDRPQPLQALDATRERDPLWYQSEQMLGGVYYVDLFAGDLKGMRAKIPYFKELGLTYLHLMPLFQGAGG
jgi:amylosucrase